MINFYKKHFYIFFIVVFFIFTKNVNASIYISEVKVSPAGERFIELYNSGDDKNLTGWSMSRKTSSGKDYPLVSASRLEGKIIKSGSYFVIVNEGNYFGTSSYDATWAKSYDIANDNTIYLYDENDTVVSKIGWGSASDCDSVCPANPPSDKSLQKTSNGWSISNPTQGEINNESSQDNSNNDNNNTSSGNDAQESSSYSTSSQREEVEKIYPITTKIIAPKIVIANIPFIINHKTFGIHKEEVILGKFVWNFGDGMQNEVAVSDPFPYIYNYPGEYVISLSFYDSLFNKSPDAIDRVNIKVIPSGIVISSVGNYLDPFIELENNSNYEMSLRDWIIKGNTKSFIIPEGTIILPGKKIKLSPRITKFDFNDLRSIVIEDSVGQIFATYPVSKPSNITFNNVKKYNAPSVSDYTDIKNEESSKEIIDLNELGANALNTQVKLSNKNLFIYATFAFVLIFGIFSIFIIRKNKEHKDYVEYELSSKDMTIIE